MTSVTLRENTLETGSLAQVGVDKVIVIITLNRFTTTKIPVVDQESVFVLITRTRSQKFAELIFTTVLKPELVVHGVHGQRKPIAEFLLLVANHREKHPQLDRLLGHMVLTRQTSGVHYFSGY